VGTVTQFPGAATLPAGCQWVCVPGQKFWHTHVCPVCDSSWTHIAPTPMTQATNEKIHTCTKCGTLVYAFVKLEEQPAEVPVAWIAVAVVGGALLQRLLDRR
jgi:hypothetical protein